MDNAFNFLPGVFGDIDNLVNLEHNAPDRARAVINYVKSLTSDYQTNMDNNVPYEQLPPVQQCYRQVIDSVSQVIHNYKEAIKEELRVEMFLELQKMYTDMLHTDRHHRNTAVHNDW